MSVQSTAEGLYLIEVHKMSMPQFHPDILTAIEARSLIGIKAGQERPDFLDIWMVVVDGRLFARSWGLKARSWYNTFLEDPQGAIRVGDAVYAVSAHPIAADDTIQDAINAAYLRKYDHGDNSFYAQGIIQPQHVAQTMELRPLDTH